LPEALQLAPHGQVLERRRLDLADALRGDAEPGADVAKRQRPVPVDPVAEREDRALALAELAERPAHGVRPEAHRDLLVPLVAARALDQLAGAGGPPRPGPA